MVPGLQENNLVTRLFNDQISGEAEFNDAAKVIWEFKQENDTIQLTTSDYWISKQDFELKEFDAKIVFFQSE